MWVPIIFVNGGLLLTVLTICSADNIISIPLDRMKTGFEVMAEKDIDPYVMEDFLLKQHHLYAPSTDTVALFKFLDSGYYGKIRIGFPHSQPFNVVFDTAWSNSWVPSINCSPSNLVCAFHAKYNSAKSKKYIPNGTPINIPLGGSKLTGYLSTDVVYLAHINVTNQTFAEMTNIPTLFSFLVTRADGVFGLAFPEDGISTFFLNLVKEKKLAKSVFSLYLNRHLETGRGGSLYLGGVDHRHYKGNFTFLGTKKSFNWQFDVDRIQMDDGKKTTLFCKNGCEAVIDSGSNAIEGPSAEIDRLNQIIGATPFAFGRYLVDCDMLRKLPKLSFVIGRRKFRINGLDYTQQLSWKGLTVCMSAFIKTGLLPPNDQLWFLGGAFLATVYVQFDTEENRIGFATAI